MTEPSTPVQTDRPIEFRSTSEEVAVGALMSGIVGSVAALILGGFVGAAGAGIGKALSGWPILGGSLLIWLAFWVLPISMLMSVKPWWRFVAVLAAGAACVFAIQWHIQYRDIGTFYRWILTALPLGIVWGIFFEPLRLARGGSTKMYVNRGISVVGGIPVYGNRDAPFLFVGFCLGLIADIVSLGQKRVGAVLGGLISGGLIALASSSVVAWRGDTTVASLFFGSAWNIAWGCAALGAFTGAISGWCAALIRERQEQRLQKLVEGGPNWPESAETIKRQHEVQSTDPVIATQKSESSP